MTITHCRIDKRKQAKLLEYFVAEVTARTAAELCGVHRNSACLFYTKLRAIITEKIVEQSPFSGEVELDESYFGGHRKGKRGRGAAGKVPVFGILKRGGKVYAQVVSDTKQHTLVPIIKTKVFPDSIVYTDSYRSYNSLDVAGFQHHRVNHSLEFVTPSNRRNHINGIENFWNQSKRILRKYNGIPKESFPLFLQECVWRFNYPTPAERLAVLKKWCYNDIAAATGSPKRSRSSRSRPRASRGVSPNRGRLREA